jgi:hypothetical protein
VRVAVAVGVAAAVKDHCHRVVQERLAVHIFGLLELLRELPELFRIPVVTRD